MTDPIQQIEKRLDTEQALLEIAPASIRIITAPLINDIQNLLRLVKAYEEQIRLYDSSGELRRDFRQLKEEIFGDKELDKEDLKRIVNPKSKQ